MYGECCMLRVRVLSFDPWAIHFRWTMRFRHRHCLAQMMSNHDTAVSLDDTAAPEIRSCVGTYLGSNVVLLLLRRDNLRCCGIGVLSAAVPDG